MRPETEQQIAEAIRGASGPLVIRGGGTRPVGRPVTGEVLETGGLSGITLYEPGALTLVVRAGTPLADVEAALAEKGQRLAFEPMDHRVLLGSRGGPTIGGVVAANVSGPRRVAVGAARDFVLGLRFVDGSGQVVKAGGRVMKNVTGYDLPKLLTGSYGTLGVLTEVGLKVLAIPQAEATLTVPGVTGEAALGVMTRSMTSPYEVTGAVHLPADAQVHLRIEGLAGSVAYRAARLRERLADLGDVQVSEDPTLWPALRDVARLADCAAVWRLSMRPSVLMREVLPQMSQANVQVDWAGGLAWIGMDAGDFHATHHWLQDQAAGRGHATLVKGPEALRRAVPVFQPEAPGVAMLTEGLRRRFDPRGILNPGLMTAPAAEPV